MVALIDEDLTRYAEVLNLDHSRSVRLDYKPLTGIANTEEGGLRLEAMGGGANAVGYHLAAYGALHKWFHLRGRPVPRFLFFDQLTMPYYVNDPELRLPDDDDRRQVQLMFEFLLALSADAGVQVIVTDHALLNEVTGFANAIRALPFLSVCIHESWFPRLIHPLATKRRSVLLCSPFRAGQASAKRA